MFTKRDGGGADQVESSISRLAGRLAIKWISRKRRAESAAPLYNVYRTCVIGQLHIWAMVQAPKRCLAMRPM